MAAVTGSERQTAVYISFLCSERGKKAFIIFLFLLLFSEREQEPKRKNKKRVREEFERVGCAPPFFLFLCKPCGFAQQKKIYASLVGSVREFFLAVFEAVFHFGKKKQKRFFNSLQERIPSQSETAKNKNQTYLNYQKPQPKAKPNRKSPIPKIQNPTNTRKRPIPNRRPR